MLELSVLCNESGRMNEMSKYRIEMPVFHCQLTPSVNGYPPTTATW